MPTPLNAPTPALPHLRDGERLVPLLTQTEASLVAYENTSPEAAFEGDNVKEALDTLFQRMPVLSGNGQLIFKGRTASATAATYARSTNWTVPQGVYECLCLVLAPGRHMAPNRKGPVPGGYAVSFRMPVSPGTQMKIALAQVLNRPESAAATAVYARILLASNTAVGCSAYASDATRWSLTFPGAELLFAKRGGDGIFSTSNTEAHNGGGFRIKDADLLDFALNGGTDAYGTPTNATASAHGTSVWGPSGALADMGATNSPSLPDGYCGGFGSAPVTDVNCSNSLVALFWGPQIRP